MTDTQFAETVLVYVRLCGNDENCRELSFQIPKGISQMDLLDAGFAIDGNSAVKSAVAYRDGREVVPLSQALRQVQTHLVSWLHERGFGVEFK